MDTDALLAALVASLRRPSPSTVSHVLGAWISAHDALTGAAWLERSTRGWTTLAAAGDGSAREPAEAPDGLPWDLLSKLGENAWRRLTAVELRAQPALVARGVRDAAIRVGEAGRALWLDADRHEVLDEPGMRIAQTLLEAVHDLGQLAKRDLEAGELEARARAALGTRHDLRNQLALTTLELERVALEPERGVEQLRSALEGAFELARAPLEHTPARATTSSARTDIHPLRALLRDEMRAAADLAAVGRSIRMALQCPRELATRARDQELRRFVRNGLLNALRATRDGGSVRLRAAALEGSAIRITIEDDGHGMPAGEAARLFEPGISGGGGTGYGTGVLVQCARSLGAELVLETELGVGTSLRLELPV